MKQIFAIVVSVGLVGALYAQEHTGSSPAPGGAGNTGVIFKTTGIASVPSCSLCGRPCPLPHDPVITVTDRKGKLVWKGCSDCLVRALRK